MASYKVYFLKSLKDKGFYIGCTSINLSHRLNKHNAGHVKSTKHRRPWKIIYFEEYNNKSTAYKREYYLKKPSGYTDKLFILEKCHQKAQPQRGPFGVG